MTLTSQSCYRLLIAVRSAFCSSPLPSSPMRYFHSSAKLQEDSVAAGCEQAVEDSIAHDNDLQRPLR